MLVFIFTSNIFVCFKLDVVCDNLGRGMLWTLLYKVGIN